MRLIHVYTQNSDGNIGHFFSYAIIDEQLADDVVEQAEAKFIEIAEKYDTDEEMIKIGLEDGWLRFTNGVWLQIMWNDAENVQI